MTDTDSDSEAANLRSGEVVCAGISSRTEHGDHILFWDLDYADKGAPDHVARELTRATALAGLEAAMEQHSLPLVVLVDAGRPRSWHAISPVRETLDAIPGILEAHPDADPGHIRMGLTLGRWILRATPKHGDDDPRAVDVLHRPTHSELWTLSQAHLDLLRDYYSAGEVQLRHVGSDAPAFHAWRNLASHYKTDGGREVEWEFYSTTKTRNGGTRDD